MGGSSVPPYELWRKFEQPTKQELAADRYARLNLIRNQLRHCKTCLELWAFHRTVNEAMIDKLLHEIRGAIAREPIAPIRVEWEAALLSPMLRLREAVQRLKGHDEWRGLALKAWDALYDGWRELYRLDRVRSGRQTRITPSEFKDIDTREEVQEYLNQLIEDRQLHRLPDASYYRLRNKSHGFGLYLPPRGATKPRLFDRSMFLLFGFQRPHSTAEERILVTSPLLKAAYKLRMRQWHPDSTTERREAVRAFWWQATQTAYQILQKRRRNFERGNIVIVEDDAMLTRTAEQMRQPVAPVNAGRMLPPAEEP